MSNKKLAKILGTLSDAQIDLLIDIYFSDFSWTSAAKDTKLSPEAVQKIKTAFEEFLDSCGNPNEEEFRDALITQTAKEVDTFAQLLAQSAHYSKECREPALPNPSSANCGNCNARILTMYEKLYCAVSHYQIQKEQ